MVTARQHPHSAQESVPSGQKEVGSMSDPQSLEEAWESVWKNVGAVDWGGLEDAIRALALAGFWAGVNIGTGGSRHTDIVAEARRIEALGK